ncbi:flagellar filament capping protein FliD [Janthinobacterium fluminis]|uniref:Flagellar hook-associated protein 2 n=1 Tax=Janthinobacterium fluminis TaxID=2987524 RepID=A0ABT5JUS4_9BURK|nr:flagellar filament capping protein FliD [Janthinobacterium fluminis]MDC8756496.1 flagellar filament capping protein FliD [Janthinobacterium fluminis]
MATAPVPYDVNASAKAWTDKYTVDRQAALTAQTQIANSRVKSLAQLKTAITSYQDALTAMSKQKTMLAQSATFSNTALGSATASPTAATGTYSFFVESLASTNQISLGGLSGMATPASGSLTLTLGNGSNFSVDLAAADKDNAGGLTPKEIAAAINAEPHNASMITASVITIGGAEKLVLTSGTGGVGGAISLTTSGLAPADAALESALEAVPTQLVPAKDAVIWLGAQGTGAKIEQGSNTFTGIDGVSMTLTKAQAPGDAPFTLSVGVDTAGTTAKVQSFVDAFNKLKGLLDSLTDPGSVEKGTLPGPFAEDSGMHVLRDQMVRTLRENNVGALATFGLTGNRQGLLTLDATKLAATLKVNPSGLDAAIGSNAVGAPSGVIGKLSTFLGQWTKVGTGQLTQRNDSLSKLQASLNKKQLAFEKDYMTMYNKYKMDFTKLNDLKFQMASNTDMFDALFGSKN